MQSLESILVAVDFSACSRAALRLAGTLAQATGARIDVLHVWHSPAFVSPGTLVGSVGAPSQPLLDVIRVRAEESLKTLVDEIRSEGIAVTDAKLLQGDPASTIIDEAKRGGYHLVALGTHGRTGLQHLLLGSVAEKVVRLAKVPVLTVRHPDEGERTPVSK